VRIAFVVHDYSRSFGHSRYVVELAERFCVEHEVHVLANTFSEAAAPGIRFHWVPACRLTTLTGILTFLVPATMRLGDKFDIIHAQGLSSLRANVVTAHICNRAWFEAQASGAAAWKQKVFKGLVVPLEERLYRRLDRAWVIAVSERVKVDLAEFYGRTKRVSVIHHGVDSDRFKPENRDLYCAEMRRRIGLSGSEKVLLFVGDLRKGAECAIKALSLVPEGKLLLISRTPPGFYKRLSEQVGVADRVIFMGATNEVERYYAVADVFVFPTPYDAFGMVISEAMSSGLAVITSYRAGAAELIEHYRDGILLDDPFDYEEVGRHLRRLIEDTDLRCRLGRLAREKMEKHSWDVVAEQTMGIYRQVLAEGACWGGEGFLVAPRASDN
jgi:UDP-glucose:(heptosyl)LPS alpha-1,3-glucosyltransferase